MHVLVSFGASVILTRVFLDLAKYPQLGGSGLHIAHLLWGGLLLVVAALLMLVYASPSVNRIGAILAGLGIGLFIDEVGKFITSDNDYFFRAAAPIIYVCFLAVALVYYLLTRRQDMLSDRELLCAALEDAESLLEANPFEQQRADLVAIVDRIRTQAKDPDHVALANAILIFAESEAVRPGKHWWERLIDRIEVPLQTYFERHNAFFTHLLIVILSVRAVGSLIAFMGSAILRFMAPDAADALRQVLSAYGLYRSSPLDLSSDLLNVLLNTATNLLMLSGVALFILRKRRRGLYWMQTSLILSLCVVNIFAFFEQQFVVAIYALIDLGLFSYIRVYVFRRQKLLDASHPTGNIPSK
jgi:hypothetical protein